VQIMAAYYNSGAWTFVFSNSPVATNTWTFLTLSLYIPSTAVAAYFQAQGVATGANQLAYWDDIDFKVGTVKVTPKPQYDFEIKDHEERAVVIPYQLVGYFLLYRMLVEGDAKSEGREVYPLVFPTKTGRPNGHMLEKCKRIAKRAKLNPDRFWLHKFRSHYATMLLRSGLDIITVRKMLGHKPGSEATFRYLAPMHHKEVRDKGADRIFEHILYPWLKDAPRVSGELEIPEGLAETSDFFARLAAETKSTTQEKAKAAGAGGESGSSEN